MMNVSRLKRFVFIIMVFTIYASRVSGPARADSFEIKNHQFMLNGKPFTILSGEMHYPRIPHQYWRHRLKMAKAMGLNTITTYVFWNIHEPEKGRFNFSGDADLSRFIRIAQEEGLYVLLRPGPYVCAEWEFGGFPYWLLTEKNMVIRSNNPSFLSSSSRYFKELGKQLEAQQADHGGNILMVQVENEYGSYASDKLYMAAIRDQILAAGFTVPLFTADGSSQMPAGYLPGVLPGLNGASGPELKSVIDKFQPGGPYIAPEFYPGWLDHWGEPFPKQNVESTAEAMEWSVKNQASISLYMFHGGTNFGFYNGANMGSAYEPHITSYDYSAPLDEAGRPTPTYNLVREKLINLLPAKSIPNVPAVNPIISIPKFELKERGSLFGSLPTPVKSENVMPMETLHQAYGYVLYRTHLQGPAQGKLALKELRDYAVIFVNGKQIGTLDRRHRQSSINMELISGDNQLDILVENGGRINYGSLLPDNLKGITKAVLFNEKELHDWQIYSLPMKSPEKLALDGKTGEFPSLFRGTFTLNALGDTWLDMRGWTKGAVWINGHALGRYWFVGPQQTLYLPAPWLKKGENIITVFEMLGNKSAVIEGITSPILNELVPETSQSKKNRPKLSSIPVPSVKYLRASGDFSNADNTQDVSFHSTKARYICFESLSSFDNSDYASCAELFLLDSAGDPMVRNSWKVVYCDSEEQMEEDGSADNLLDFNTDTIWHSVWSAGSSPHPHRVVIDLGGELEFSGFRYVPRPGQKPGKIKGYRFYSADEPFGAF